MNPEKSLPKRARGEVPPSAEAAVPTGIHAKKPRIDTGSGVRPSPQYLLRLFVSGFTPRSQRAIDNLQNICELYLPGRHRIEVVDLYQSPGAARDEQIIATPTLLKIQPHPIRRIIGDLSQVEKVLHGLDIK